MSVLGLARHPCLRCGRFHPLSAAPRHRKGTPRLTGIEWVCAINGGWHLALLVGPCRIEVQMSKSPCHLIGDHDRGEYVNVLHRLT